MSEPGKAVFLSYASQDAEAAKKICEALRAAGVEVWFDQSELRGGDAWDAMIRRRIKECALFVPLITPTTNARAEGYFRLEWKLAVDRSHLMADDAPFLFPIVIGDVTDATARVPDKFRDVQWTRLRLDETPAELGARVAKLLGGAPGEAGGARPRSPGGPARPAAKPAWLRHAWMGVGLLFALIYAVRPLLQEARRPGPKPMAPAPAAPAAPAISEARQLIAKARALSLDKYDSSADDFAAAEGLLKQALALDQNDGEIWAFSSLFNTSMRTRGFDHASVRREMARRDAERALKLAPDSFEALYALGRAQRDFEPEAAEKTFNQLLARKPDDPGTLGSLAWIYDRTGRVDEAAAIYERLVKADPAHAALNRYTEFLLFFHYNRLAEADRCIRESVALQPSANSQGALAMLLLSWKGEADEAARVLATGPTASRNEPRTIWITAFVDLCRRAPDHALKTLDRLADDFIQDNWFTGPKAYFAGRAQQLAGRPEAARIAWESALALTNTRLKDAPGDLVLHLVRGQLLAFLGQPDEALREARAVAELARGDDRNERYWFSSPALIYAALGRADEALPLLEKLSLAPPGQIVGWPLTPALLRLDPIWDRIRDDPRFQKLCAEPAVAAAAAAGDASSAKATEDRSGQASPPDQKSVAVLAFANLSDDKANEYFSDGISEELLNVLAKIPGLKVTARTSSFHFKGKDTAIPEIARQLGVAYVIEGSVRKAGDKVRITAQLIKAADDFQVWSDTFTRDLKDIFAVQDEIAGLIAQSLQIRLGTGDLIGSGTTNPEALQLYLEGRQAWNLRSEAGCDQAEALLNRALELDPRFARAHAALADVWYVRNQKVRMGAGWADRNSPANTKILAKINQALALDPNCAEAYASLGAVRGENWEIVEAVRDLRRAVALNPNYATAHQWLANQLLNLGFMDEGLAEFRRAAELDPLSHRILDNLSWALSCAGRYGEAWETLERARALRPNGTQIACYRATLLLQQGRMGEALAEARRLLTPELGSDDPGFARYVALSVLVAGGQRPEAEALLAQFPPAGDDRVLALVYLGRRPEALALLDTVSPGFVQYILYGTPLHEFDAVRNDPVLQAWLAKTGLTEAHNRAQAWRAAHPPEKSEMKP